MRELGGFTSRSNNQDCSSITVRRDIELANLKLTYEEQLETLRS